MTMIVLIIVSLISLLQVYYSIKNQKNTNIILLVIASIFGVGLLIGSLYSLISDLLYYL